MTFDLNICYLCPQYRYNMTWFLNHSKSYFIFMISSWDRVLQIGLAVGAPSVSLLYSKNKEISMKQKFFNCQKCHKTFQRAEWNTHLLGKCLWANFWEEEKEESYD